MCIYGAITGKNEKEIEEEFSGLGYGAFKTAVGEKVVEKLKPVQEKYKDWQVIGFEKGKVTLYKEFDDVCGEHFKLKIENGKVVVYTVNNDGTETLYEKTNISSEYLTETDLLNMQDGLEIYGKEELNQVIEDFE